MKKHFEILAIDGMFEDKFLAAEAALIDKMMAIGKRDEDDGEEEESYILQIGQGVGVIEIKGMLTNVDSWINRFFGMLSYDEIRRATAQALDAGVGGIMYLVASPGGRVAGMQGTAELISSLPVPSMAYTDETMASAALFLGIQADEVLAGDFASVGSVGVIATVMDYTEAMKKQGIKAERFRSGDLKQAGNPMFKLTDKERAYMKEQTGLYAEKFYNIVSEARGIPRPMLDALDITSGRSFIGPQALQAGLVDSIASFDEAFMKISGLAKKNIDSRDTGNVRYGNL